MFARRDDQHHRGPRRAARGAAQPLGRADPGRRRGRHAGGRRRARPDARLLPTACARGASRGIDGGRFTDIVNIGIGGSDLGPVMATLALTPYRDGPRSHFVSNVDGAHLADTLRALDPAAHAVHRRLEDLHHPGDDDQRRLGAQAWLPPRSARTRSATISPPSRPTLDEVADFGIDPTACSASGTGSAAAIRSGRRSACRSRSRSASSTSREFLDRRPRRWTSISATRRSTENLPVLLGLLGVWYRNVLGCPTRTRCCPTTSTCPLRRPTCSSSTWRCNGKRVTPRRRAGRLSHRPGHLGRARHQRPACLLPADPPGHRASIPARFPGRRASPRADARRPPGQAASPTASPRPRRWPSARPRRRRAPSWRGQGLHRRALERSLPHKVFPGNRPSTRSIYPQARSRDAGPLIALYEHKVFVAGRGLGHQLASTSGAWSSARSSPPAAAGGARWGACGQAGCEHPRAGGEVPGAEIVKWTARLGLEKTTDIP